MCILSNATEVLQDYPDGKHVSCTVDNCHEKLDNTWKCVRSHLKEMHPSYGILCKICNEMYFSEEALKSHTKTTHMKNIKCDFPGCEMSYSSAAKLRVHQQAHGQEAGKTRDFVCNQCGQAFFKSTLLKSHIRYVHEGYRSLAEKSDKIITCEKCGESLRECRYRYHKKRCHSAEKHDCPECNKSFNHRDFLVTHMTQSHIMQTCDQCGEQVSKRSIKDHILRNHTAESKKPYHCSVCNKGFIKKHVLEEHMNIHTGARPYKCLFCDKSCANQSNSFKHMRTSHAEQYRAYKDAQAKDK